MKIDVHCHHCQKLFHGAVSSPCAHCGAWVKLPKPAIVSDERRAYRRPAADAPIDTHPTDCPGCGDCWEASPEDAGRF